MRLYLWPHRLKKGMGELEKVQGRLAVITRGLEMAFQWGTRHLARGTRGGCERGSSTREQHGQGEEGPLAATSSARGGDH